MTTALMPNSWNTHFSVVPSTVSPVDVDDDVQLPYPIPPPELQVSSIGLPSFALDHRYKPRSGERMVKAIVNMELVEVPSGDGVRVVGSRDLLHVVSLCPEGCTVEVTGCKPTTLRFGQAHQFPYNSRGVWVALTVRKQPPSRSTTGRDRDRPEPDDIVPLVPSAEVETSARLPLHSKLFRFRAPGQRVCLHYLCRQMFSGYGAQFRVCAATFSTMIRILGRRLCCMRWYRVPGSSKTTVEWAPEEDHNANMTVADDTPSCWVTPATDATK